MDAQPEPTLSTLDRLYESHLAHLAVAPENIIERAPATTAAWRYLGMVMAFAAGYALVTLLTPFGAATTPDSLSYLEVARNLAAGRGLVVANTEFPGIPPFVALTTWPPVYPVLLALGPAAGSPHGAALIGGVLLGLSAAAFFYLAARACSIVVAAAATLFLLSLQAILCIYAFAWSEGPFVLFELLALIAALAATRQPWGPRAFVALGVSALAFGLATASRYIGIAFVPVLAVAAWLIGRTVQRWFALSVLSGIVYGAAVAPVILRNLLLTGTPGGFVWPPSDRGLVANLADFLSVLRFQFGSFERLPLLAAIAIAAVAAGLVWWLYGRSLVTPSGGHDETRTLAVLALTAGLTYWVAVVLMRTVYDFDLISLRFVAPGIPCMLLGGLAGLRLIAHTRPFEGRLAAALVGAWASLVAVQGGFAFSESRDAAATYGNPLFGTGITGAVYNSYSAGPMMDLWRAVADRVDADWTATFVLPDAQAFSMITGRRAVQPPVSLNGLDRGAIETLNKLPQPAFLVIDAPAVLRQLVAQSRSPRLLQARSLVVNNAFANKRVVVLALPLPGYEGGAHRLDDSGPVR